MGDTLTRVAPRKKPAISTRANAMGRYTENRLLLYIAVEKKKKQS